MNHLTRGSDKMNSFQTCYQMVTANFLGCQGSNSRFFPRVPFQYTANSRCMCLVFQLKCYKCFQITYLKENSYLVTQLFSISKKKKIASLTVFLWTEHQLSICLASLHKWKVNQQDKHTLPEVDMSNSHINIVIGWVSTVNHQTINKFHGLGTLTTELPRHHNFTAFGSTLHDESKHTITSPVHNDIRDFI